MMHCEEGNLNEVKRIIESGTHTTTDIEIEYKNENGLTLLALAVKNRRY